MASMRRTIAALMSTLLLASACSSGDDDTAGDDGDTLAVESTKAPTASADETDGADGDTDATDDVGPSAGGEIPGGVDASFPVPFPEGWVVDTQAALAGVVTTGAASVLYTVDDLDRVVAFYDDWTSDQADITRADSGDSVRYVRADPIVSITVLPDFEYEGDTYTALQVSAASG
jgi:hypothetical protein